ncbi:methyltransferase [Marinobacter sp.]|uniref:methyltransferase n=1 Tax=Marinobacter sp. TaxID=50741 RepID=UPI00384B558A
MSASPQSLPNSHEVLLRNRKSISGTLALIGVTDPALLAALPDGGLAMTDHHGVFGQMQGHLRWQPAFGYDDPALQPGMADSAVVFLPKARSELTLRLDLAKFLLATGGRILLIGEKREGIAGGIRQLRELASDAIKLDSARHCQVWLAQPQLAAGKNGEAADHFDIAARLSWHSFEVAGTAVDVAGLPGIFSDGRLDEGTRVLLESLAEMKLQGPVLDFACGAGPVGAWLHARSQGRLTVDGVDVQSQAVFCARRTYQRNGVQGDIIPSDGLPDTLGSYQTVVTNPPFHTGVKTDTSMTASFLQQAARHLKPGGQLILVANSFLPYESLIRQHIGFCQKVGGARGFTVYKASRTQS